MSKIKIAIVDDHQILIDSLKSLLELDPSLEVVFTITNGQDLIAHEQLFELDIIVLDINMKGYDGLQTLEDLNTDDLNAKVIFLTTYQELHLVEQAFALGARGYVTKVSAAQYLVEAIKEVQNGNTFHSPDIKERILNSFGSKEKAKSGEHEIRSISQLTDRELEVLKLIASQFTSDEIANKLHIAKSTVDTHRKNLISKLQVKNAVGLGLFAERNGLI